MLPVHPLELLRIEDRRFLRQSFGREELYHLRNRHYLDVVPGRPAEQGEKVEHRLRQYSHVPIVTHRRRTVPLAELLPVHAVDHRQMREARENRAERLV